MRNFLLGLSVGVILATGLTAWAQLSPIESTLEQRLHMDALGQALSRERAVERLEQETERDAFMRSPLLPCPR